MSGKFTPGPFIAHYTGISWVVESEAGVRIADCDDDEDSRSKAEQVCAALNAAHYLAMATGSAA